MLESTLLVTCIFRICLYHETWDHKCVSGWVGSRVQLCLSHQWALEGTNEDRCTCNWKAVGGSHYGMLSVHVCLNRIPLWREILSCNAVCAHCGLVEHYFTSKQWHVYMYVHVCICPGFLPMSIIILQWSKHDISELTWRSKLRAHGHISSCTRTCG